MKVQPVVAHETTDEWMKGKPQSAEQVVEENYPLMRFRGRDDLPRSGQRIVSPDFLADYRPDTVIVMNPIYRAEIAACLAARGCSSELVTV